MKKSIFLFTLAVAAALLLTGCGQSQTGAQTPADSTSVSSSIGDKKMLPIAPHSSRRTSRMPAPSPLRRISPQRKRTAAWQAPRGRNKPAIRRTQVLLRAEMCLPRLLQISRLLLTRPQLSPPHPVQDPSRRPLLFLNRKPGRNQKQSRNPPKPPRLTPLSPVQTGPSVSAAGKASPSICMTTLLRTKSLSMWAPPPGSSPFTTLTIMMAGSPSSITTSPAAMISQMVLSPSRLRRPGRCITPTPIGSSSFTRTPISPLNTRP